MKRESRGQPPQAAVLCHHMDASQANHSSGGPSRTGPSSGRDDFGGLTGGTPLPELKEALAQGWPWQSIRDLLPPLPKKPEIVGSMEELTGITSVLPLVSFQSQISLMVKDLQLVLLLNEAGLNPLFDAIKTARAEPLPEEDRFLFIVRNQSLLSALPQVMRVNSCEQERRALHRSLETEARHMAKAHHYGRHYTELRHVFVKSALLWAGR